MIKVEREELRFKVNYAAYVNKAISEIADTGVWCLTTAGIVGNQLENLKDVLRAKRDALVNSYFNTMFSLGYIVPCECNKKIMNLRKVLDELKNNGDGNEKYKKRTRESFDNAVKEAEKCSVCESSGYLVNPNIRIEEVSGG